MKFSILAAASALLFASCDAHLGSPVILKTEEFKTLSLIPTEELGNQGSTHYGDPYQGCQSDELQIRVQGIQGAMCSPACNGMSCPSDIPTGCTARPQCALQDGVSRKRYCALICNSHDDCGENATCKMVGNVGVCTYDS